VGIENIRKVAIIGAGLMGHGIAQVFAQAGYQVSMQSRREKSVQQAFERIEANLQTLVESGLVEEAPSQILARIEGTTNMNEAAENADFVVEAVPEVLSVKKEVFKNLDKICSEHAILASNTSGLSITEIASATNRPEKVVGTHFWNPPHLVQAVEIVRGLKTSDNTVKITQELLVKVGKKPVIISKDIFGQVGIRILYAMLREAISLLEKDVASVEDIDVVVREALGTRLSVMGLFEMADLSGLDLVAKVSEYLYKDLERTTELSPLLKEKVKKGELGAKTGKGFYDWSEKALSSIMKRRDEHLIRLLKEKK